MTDLNHKYKDRDPMETVNIINTFFQTQGYNVQVAYNVKTEAATFWCHLTLIDPKTNFEILRSNGKGTTLEYSLASGYAELYERYCGGFHHTYETSLAECMNNYTNYNYYINAQEKLLNLNEIENNCLTIKSFFEYFKEYKEIIYDLQLNFYTNSNGKLPCIPFYSLNGKNTIYLNPGFMNKILGSDGLAAGNTIEEAAVQGMSEIYEHYVTDRIYYEKNTVYYELNLDKMLPSLSNYLVEIITNIKKEGYSLSILDLSYNFNMPVLMSIVIDKNHLMYIDLGAAPTFEIALERTLTEIYQGRNDFKISMDKQELKPYRAFSLEESIYNNYSSVTTRNNYPEELLLNRKIVDDYNHKVFLPSNTFNNLQLLNHYIQLNKENNFDIYIRDISKTKEIRAVRLICANKAIFPWRYTICDQLSKEEKDIISTTLLALKDVQPFSDEYFSILEIFNKIPDFFSDDKIDAYKEFIAFLFDQVELIFPIKDLNTFFNFCTKQMSEIMNNNIRNNFTYFKLLYNYKASNKYSDEEIIDILKILGYNQKYLEIDCQNVLDKKYTIRNIFLRSEEEF